MQSSGILRKNEIFELDTRINQSIQKQIEPYIHNFYKNQALLTDLNLKYEAKITEAQRINQNYQPLYNEVNNKISFIEKKLENLIKQSIIQPSKLQQDLTNIQNQINQMNEVIQNNEQKSQNTQRQLINLEQQNENFKLDIQRLMELQHSSQTQLATELKQQIFNLEQAERKLSLKLQNFDNLFSEDNKKFSQLQQKITEITKSIENKKDLEELNQKVVKQNQEIQNLQKYMSNFDKVTEKVCLIETYLTQNLQYHIQDQINESLFICLPVRQFFKYTQYEKQKHEMISKQLVSLKKNKTLQQLIEDVEKILLNAAKRQQKVTEIVKKMDDVSDDENENGDGQVQNKKRVSKKKNQSSSDNKMNQEENNQKNQNQSNLVYFEEQLKQVRDYFDSKFEDAYNTFSDINRKINQLSNDLYTSQIMFQAEIDKNLQSSLAQNKKKFESIEKQFAELSQIYNQSGIFQLNEQLRHFKQSSRQILLFCKNILAIMQQDEIDKQGMKLLGCRDLQIDDTISSNNRYNGMKRSSISIDRDCLSCSGQPIQVMKLFKIACLNYASSDVFLDGTLYKREDLFEKCCQILCQELKQTQFKNQKLSSIKKRSISIQESPKFFTTERGLKLQNISHYKIFM